MPFPSTYLSVTCRFKNSVTSALATSRLYYLPQSAFSPTLANIATFANGFRTAFLTAVTGAHCPDVVMSSVALRWVSGGLEVEGENNNGVIVGTIPGDTLPEEDVLVIHRRTGMIGRQNRGRVFWPFVPKDFVGDGGELSASGILAAVALAGMVKSNVVSNGTTFIPQTIDFKDAVARPVVQSGYLVATGSRRDRRFPKQTVAVRI